VASEIEPCWVSRDLGDFKPTPLTICFANAMVVGFEVSCGFRGYLLGHGVKTQPLKSRRIAAESPSSFTHGQCHDAEGKLGDCDSSSARHRS